MFSNSNKFRTINSLLNRNIVVDDTVMIDNCPQVFMIHYFGLEFVRCENRKE